MIEGARRFRQSPSTPWRRVGGDVILAPPGRDDFHLLSGTGADVWELLEIPSTLTELVGQLAEQYGVEGQHVAADIEPLLADLLQSGAIDQIEEAQRSHVDVR